MTDNMHQTHLGTCRTHFDGHEGSSSVLLVGEDNPISSRPEHALFPLPKGCSGNLLQTRILDCNRAAYLAMWRTNLCVGGWKVDAARIRARELLRQDTPWSVIVLLGKKVAWTVEGILRGAGATVDLSPLSVTPVLRLTLVCIPHPSGINRVWNIPGMISSSREVVRRAAPDVEWGSA